MGGHWINDPYSAISHENWKNITWLYNFGTRLAFDLTITNNVDHLTKIVAPRGVATAIVVVEYAGSAGQHGRIVSLGSFSFFLDTSCMRRTVMKSNVSSSIGGVFIVVIKWSNKGCRL